MTTCTFYWTNELVFELIRLFEEKPELWDITSEHFRDKDKKQESWLEIANAMRTDVSTVEKKMKMLVSQYRRELLTKRNNSKWFAFQRLSFLNLKSRQIPVSFKNRQRSSCFVSVDQDQVGQNSKSNYQSDTLRIQKPLLKERMNIARIRGHKIQERDEYATYGELVAMKLKKIGNAFARSTAQYHINNILYKAEIGAYDRHPRHSESYKPQIRAESSSTPHNESNYDVHSQRSSSPTKSIDYDLKLEEIEGIESDA